MRFGLKCDGCNMWTRVFDLNVAHVTRDRKKPYYCDECLANVTYHTTKARIKTGSSWVKSVSS